jgi:hypothetical protein
LPQARPFHRPQALGVVGIGFEQETPDRHLIGGSQALNLRHDAN